MVHKIVSIVLILSTGNLLRSCTAEYHVSSSQYQQLGPSTHVTKFVTTSDSTVVCGDGNVAECEYINDRVIVFYTDAPSDTINSTQIKQISIRKFSALNTIIGTMVTVMFTLGVLIGYLQYVHQHKEK